MTTDHAPEPTMVPMYGVSITGEAPARLADLESVATDLRFAQRVLARLPTVDYQADPDLSRALYDAGAIAYRRGFTSGRALVAKGESRTKVPVEILDALDDTHRAVHQRLLDHANTHVAHRVGELEQVRVMVLLDNPALGKSVQGVSGFGLRLMCLNTEDARHAAEAAGLIAGAIENYLEAFRTALIADAKDRDIDELYEDAYPLGTVVPPTTHL